MKLKIKKQFLLLGFLVSLMLGLISCGKKDGNLNSENEISYAEAQKITNNTYPKTTSHLHSVCTSDKPSAIKLTLHEYTYPGDKPPNALVCSVTEFGKTTAKAFTHKIALKNWCRNQLTNKYIAEYKAKGYTCSELSPASRVGLTAPENAPPTNTAPATTAPANNTPPTPSPANQGSSN